MGPCKWNLRTGYMACMLKRELTLILIVQEAIFFLHVLLLFIYELPCIITPTKKMSKIIVRSK